MLNSNYFSYLIRIWQGDDLPGSDWLASLEDPTSQQLIYFNTLEELFAFLHQRSSSGQDESTTLQDGSGGQGRQFD